MRRLVCLLFAVSASAQLFADSTSRYMIVLKPAAAASRLRMVSNAAEAAAHNVRTFETADLVAADLTDAEVSAMKRAESVAYVSPVVARVATGFADETTTPLLRQQPDVNRYVEWQIVPPGIDAVRARELWRYTRGRGKVNVAIVDTGIDYNHPDLKARYAGGYNTFTKDAQAMDDYSHGTHVAGTVAASDNGFGVVGVAPEVRLWAVKVLDSRGSGSDETVTAGIDWVIARKRQIGGNWIVNLSLGADAPSDPERAMFAKAIAEGIIVVAAAGNTATTFIEYPAAYPGVLAISAIDATGALAEFSTYGSGIAFAAPGVNVLSSVPAGWAKTVTIETERFRIGTALPLTGSAVGQVTAETIYCGLGKPAEIPAEVRGQIALIKRGDIFFRDKAKNAIKAGAVAVIILPPFDDLGRSEWTLLPPETCKDNVCTPSPEDVNFPWTIVVSTSMVDAESLLQRVGETITLSYAKEDYAIHSGTSMATPHVVGAAALVWSLAPDATADQVRLAMKMSAFDLGPHGYDVRYGYGRIDAWSAARYISPGMFGLDPQPLPGAARRRSAGGH